MAGRSKVDPSRMTDAQLWARARSLVAQARYTSMLTLPQREAALDQLDAILRELHLRGTQLSLV